jgi:hypothetical protein
MGVLREIVFDCEQPAALARFWAAVLDGYAVREYDAAEVARLAATGLTPETDPTVMVDGPGPHLCFQEAREPGAAKGRMHMDVVAVDRRAEVARLCRIGAAFCREGPDYTVLSDPEGNRFCVIDAR